MPGGGRASDLGRGDGWAEAEWCFFIFNYI